MRRVRDRGFTLVEVLIVIVLVTVVTSTVGAALVLGIRTTDESYTRLDQSNAAFAVQRRLSSDVFAAEGPLGVGSTDTSCGGAAPLRMAVRSSAAEVPDTTVVWALEGTDLVRRTCTGDVIASSAVVARGISRFTTGTCAESCTEPLLTVSITTAGSGRVPERAWSFTVGRRGATT